MKTIYSILICFAIHLANAQVAIGKDAVDGSGILDFAENTDQGIILPWITETPVSTTGSIIYDTNDKKVKVYDGTSWQDLSIKEGAVNTNEIDELNDIGGGIIIGAEHSNRKGVLVLEDNTKALILPKSNAPWVHIKNPEAGMMVYDDKAKLICVYNGSEWTFWGIDAP